MPIKDKVLFYEGKYYMFSNFSSFAVEWKGNLMMTSEHAYQSEKFLEQPEIYNQIVHARSAHDAKQIAKANTHLRRSDWNEVKLGIMEKIIRAKHAQHPFIQKRLLETEDALMVEDSPKDSFWGRGSDWQGENHLGKLWMKIRSEHKV